MMVNNENVFKLSKTFACANDENERVVALKVSKRSRVANEGDVTREENKAQVVQRYLMDNIDGCDLALCLFIAALFSYRTDRCLRPFPSSFVHNGNKNLGKLREVCNTIPPLDKLTLDKTKNAKEIFDLLHWIIFESGQPALKKIDLVQLPAPVIIQSSLKPTYVFELEYSSKLDEAWESRKRGRDTIWAFHGSQIDNFYSILKVGLQQHFSTEQVLFGNGIYLTNELTLSTNYSPYSQTWNYSFLGSKQSIIAVCEIINDVERVKFKDENYKSRAVSKDSYDEIPEKYFVVTDSDMVRVKYLLVYTVKSVSNLRSFLYNNLLCTLIFLYILLLLFIGFVNNSNWKKYYYQIYRIFCNKGT